MLFYQFYAKITTFFFSIKKYLVQLLSYTLTSKCLVETDVKMTSKCQWCQNRHTRESSYTPLCKTPFSSFFLAPVGFMEIQFGQDQDQDSLLVKRRNDNHSPGPVIRELVPSFHQRSELSNTILCIFSRWDQRIGEGIPIPDSLGEEATFINICIGNGSLKCHRVLIPTTPSFGDKVICWYIGFTFKTFI